MTDTTINPAPAEEVPIAQIVSDAFYTHPHIPKWGGEIAWNDIQAIGQLNANITLLNRERAKLFLPQTSTLPYASGTYQYYMEHEDSYYFPGKLPYIRPLDPSGFVSQGFNQHGHTGPGDGGSIVGAGNHDHYNNSRGGFSFAVMAPGTGIPMRNVVIE